MIWFLKVARLDSETMREIADAAGVSWSAESVVYRGNGIGFADGDSADAAVIQDAAESIIGIRPVEIDAPPESDQE